MLINPWTSWWKHTDQSMSKVSRTFQSPNIFTLQLQSAILCHFLNEEPDLKCTQIINWPINWIQHSTFPQHKKSPLPPNGLWQNIQQKKQPNPIDDKLFPHDMCVCVWCLCSKLLSFHLSVIKLGSNALIGVFVHCAPPASTMTSSAGVCAFWWWCTKGASEAPSCPRRQRRERLNPRCLSGASSRHALIINTRHSHPWSDAVGGEGVSGWECTGGLKTGVREGEESVDGVRWE